MSRISFQEPFRGGLTAYLVAVRDNLSVSAPEMPRPYLVRHACVLRARPRVAAAWIRRMAALV